jgi:lipoate-protein ligase A
LRLLVVDYVFADLKFGGNAQAITSQRWLHHTSFLWDYNPANMQALKNPAKQPMYRQVQQQMGSFPA